MLMYIQFNDITWDKHLFCTVFTQISFIKWKAEVVYYPCIIDESMYIGRADVMLILTDKMTEYLRWRMSGYDCNVLLCCHVCFESVACFSCREQRVTGTMVFILTGLSVLMAPILKVWSFILIQLYTVFLHTKTHLSLYSVYCVCVCVEFMCPDKSWQNMLF